MRAQWPGWAAVRAVIAVAALYALALQAILGGAVTAGASRLDHTLCLPGGPTANDGSSKVPASHSHLSCCTAAHHQPVLGAPQPAASPVVWPQGGSAILAWRPEVVSAPRAPPRYRQSARAPPVV